LTNVGNTIENFHAGRSVLKPRRIGERDHRVLAGTVGGQPNGVELPGQRGDVNDVPLSTGDHALHRQLAAQDHAVDVDVENAPGDGVRLVDNPADGHDAGVVDQHVDRAELALNGVEKIRERIPVCHIEFAVHIELELGTRLLHLHLVDITDRDLGAQVMQCRRGGQSDSPCPACDDDDLAPDLDADGCRVCHFRPSGYLTGVNSGIW